MRTWSEARARKAIKETCSALELPLEAAQLVRLGSQATYRIGDLALRIAPLGTEISSSAAELALADILKQAGVPVVEPFASAPMRLKSGYVVSLWRYLEHSSARVPPRAFGALLRQFHDTTASSQLKLPPLELSARLARRLDAVESAAVVSADDVDMLRARVERLAKALEACPATVLGEGILHGDAHPGNVIVGPLGPVLSDFESVCRGPREWDLVPMALQRARFGLSEREWEQFVDGYGYDVRDWEGYESYVACSALFVTCNALESYSKNRQEAEARLRFWRQGERNAKVAARLWQQL